ncbi:MAG: hypothetical protein ACQGVK_13625 [Myxococcota bacterium]
MRAPQLRSGARSPRRPVAAKAAKAALAALVLGLAACASPTAPLTARSPMSRPELNGHSLAVLPPIAFGPEQGPAAGWDRAGRAIWGRQLGGVAVVAPERVSGVLADDPAAFDRVRRSLLRQLPIDAVPQSGRRTLLDGESIGSVEMGSRIWVTIRASTGALGAGPQSLDTEWLSRFGADYVLLSIAFRGYDQHTRVSAILGFLPVFGTTRVNGQRPRGNLLLFDAHTGRLVWNAFVGGELDADTDARLPDEFWPPLAAAHLLTGALQEPLLRLMGIPAEGP